jgi:hypothetical protein
VPPPTYPEPILDGAAFYDVNAPDCGFGKALEQLKPTGGTLLLPAGRYVLMQPLSVPSRVTLAGQGLSTVLVGGFSGNPDAVVVIPKGREQVTVRDLTFLRLLPSVGGMRDRTPHGVIAVEGARQVRLEALADLPASLSRILAEEVEMLTIQDCRIVSDSLQPHGTLVLERSSGVRVTTSLLSTTLLRRDRDIAIVGNLLDGVGAILTGEGRSEGILIAANVASRLRYLFERGKPVGPVAAVTGSALLANLVVGPRDRSSGLSPIECGQAWYNLLTDDLLTAPDWSPYPEETEAHANLLAPLYRPQPDLRLPPDNLARTFLPAGTSFEEMPATK